MRTLAKCLGGAVLFAGIVIIVQERSALARVRAEHEELLDRQREVQQLKDENAELDALRTANVQIKQLERDNHDLPKLRNDVRRLREQAAEAAHLRAENERLAAIAKRISPPSLVTAVPPGFIPRASMRDLGLATPEAAVQTYFNALCNGDVHRKEECEEGTVDAHQGTQSTAEQVARQHQAMLDQAASFMGYRIADRREVGPDRLEIDIQGNAGGPTLLLHLKREGNEWTVNP